MADDFDPDAYLAGFSNPPGDQSPPAQSGASPAPAGPAMPAAPNPPPAADKPVPAWEPGGFDPDAYLKGDVDAKPADQPYEGPGSGNMFTDVWPEMKQAASGAWETIKKGLGPEKSAELAKEYQNTPWWDISPTANSVLRTGRAVLSAAGLPLSVGVAAPARSLIGHPLASLDQAITGGENAPGAIGKEESPQETYQRWAGNVDTALSAMGPKGEMVPGPVPKWSVATKPPPQIPGASEPFGVVRSEGQKTGNLDAIQRESEAISGSAGPAAQKRAVQFFGAKPYVEGQQPAQLAAAKEGISEQLSGPHPVVDSPQDAADLIHDELSTNRRTVDQGLQQEGHQLAGDMLNYHAGLSPGRTPIHDPMQAANVVSGAIAARAEQAQAAITAAYDQLGQVEGNFHPATFNNIDRVLTAKARSGPDPTIINPQVTPIAHSALTDLDDVLSGLKQQRDPETNRIIPRPPITAQVVENARKRLNVFYGQAIQAARSSNNWSDVRAMRGIIDNFDDYVADRLQAGTWMGGDASQVLDTMQHARQLYANYRRTFTPQGQGDAVGKVIQSVLGQYEGQAATPEQVRNLLYKGQNAPKVAARLVQMFGPDSPEMGAVRQGFISHMLEAEPGKPPLGAGEIADKIDAVTGGASRSPPTLTRTYFNPQQINDLRALGQRFRQHATALAPVTDAAHELATALGDPNTSNADVVQKLFKRALAGNEVPAQVMTRLSPQGQAAFRTGLFRQAVQPIEGVADWGPKKVGDNLAKLLNATRNTQIYSPAQRDMIKAYADLMRTLEVPKTGANWSGTETFRQRYLRGFGGLIGRFVVGDLLAHVTGIPWIYAEALTTAGIAAQRIAGDAMKARRIAKQLPIVTEQLQKYQKALTAYNKSNNIATRRLVGTAFSNFARSAQQLGISPNLLPPPPSATDQQQ